MISFEAIPVSDQDVVPPGFMRLHHALRETVELLNIADGCDQTSGLPLNYSFSSMSEDELMEEWKNRCQRTSRAESLLWQAIAGSGEPRRLVIYTRRNMHVEPQKMEVDAFHRTGFRRVHSLTCGLYLTYERQMPSGEPFHLNEMPLLTWEADWTGLKTFWQKDVLKFDNPSAAAESECRKWLRAAFANDEERSWRKADFAIAAKTRFGSRLSARSFSRAWAATAPQAGRDRAGAPPKSMR